MRAIGEFDADLTNGEVIRIPEIFKRQLEGVENVRVILLTKEPPKPLRAGIIREMIENPVIIPGFKAPSRDEIYEGR